jgi:hypothetical protein
VTERRGGRAWLAIAAAYLAFAAIVVRAGLDRIELCPTHLLTGWRCPLCGLTRSVGSLLAFDAAAAWRWNPLGFVALPLLLAVVGSGVRSFFVERATRATKAT